VLFVAAPKLQATPFLKGQLSRVPSCSWTAASSGMVIAVGREHGNCESLVTERMVPSRRAAMDWMGPSGAPRRAFSDKSKAQ